MNNNEPKINNIIGINGIGSLFNNERRSNLIKKAPYIKKFPK